MPPKPRRPWSLRRSDPAVHGAVQTLADHRATISAVTRVSAAAVSLESERFPVRVEGTDSSRKETGFGAVHPGSVGGARPRSGGFRQAVRQESSTHAAAFRCIGNELLPGCAQNYRKRIARSAWRLPGIRQETSA